MAKTRAIKTFVQAVQPVAPKTATLDTAALGIALAQVKLDIANLQNDFTLQGADLGKKASDAAFNAAEALKAAATAAVEISKLPGQLTDVIVNNNEKISEVRIDLQNLSLAHTDLATWVGTLDASFKSISAPADLSPYLKTVDATATYATKAQNLALNAALMTAIDDQAVANDANGQRMAALELADRTINTALGLKADNTALGALSTTVTNNKTSTDTALALKADKTALASTDTNVALKADKTALTNTDTAVTALTTRVTAIEAVPTATVAEFTARNTNVRRFTPKMIVSGIQTIASETKWIGEWNPATTYSKDGICLKNKAFFISTVDSNLNHDPESATDVGKWAPFTPNSASDIFMSRSPTNLDLQPLGVRWFDTSYSASNPLVLVSMGNGVWNYVTTISLAKIRLYCSGSKSTYRSSINNVRFYTSTGIQINNGSFVCGDTSGIGMGSPGVAYAGQQIYCGYNSAGWVEITVGSAFDTSVKIGSIVGDYAVGNYVSCSQVEFYYTNGSKRTYSAAGNQSGANITICTCDPPLDCKIGDTVAAAQGPMLTAGQLSNNADLTYGRINGQAFVSAVQNIVGANQKSPNQAAFDSLMQRVQALETRVGP